MRVWRGNQEESWRSEGKGISTMALLSQIRPKSGVETVNKIGKKSTKKRQQKVQDPCVVYDRVLWAIARRASPLGTKVFCLLIRLCFPELPDRYAVRIYASPHLVSYRLCCVSLTFYGICPNQLKRKTRIGDLYKKYPKLYHNFRRFKCIKRFFRCVKNVVCIPMCLLLKHCANKETWEAVDLLSYVIESFVRKDFIFSLNIRATVLCKHVLLLQLCRYFAWHCLLCFQTLSSSIYSH